jgi:hypothetical protein
MKHLKLMNEFLLMVFIELPKGIASGITKHYRKIKYKNEPWKI